MNKKQLLYIPIGVLSAAAGIIVFYFVRAEGVDARFDAVNKDIAEHKIEQAQTIGTITGTVSVVSTKVDDVINQQKELKADVRAIMDAFGVKRQQPSK